MCYPPHRGGDEIMSKKKLEVGDVVKLNQMVIEEIRRDRKVFCVYFIGSELYKHWFAPEELEFVRH